MNLVRKRKIKLIAIAMFLLGCALALILYALRQNINLFYSPSQIIAEQAPLHRVIRVGGVVVKGSVIRQDLDVEFNITDNQKTITIIHHGSLPDLFREGQSIVVLGELVEKNKLKAIEVLAKHDENYMPPEVKAMLDAKGEQHG